MSEALSVEERIRAARAAYPRRNSPKAQRNSMTETNLRPMTDTEALRELTRLIFTAGNTEKSVAQRWPAFEDAFLGFDPSAVAALGVEAIGPLHASPYLIRHRSKLSATLSNARTLVQLTQVYGSFSAIIDALAAETYERRAAFIRSMFHYVGPVVAYRFLRLVGLADESDYPAPQGR